MTWSTSLRRKGPVNRFRRGGYHSLVHFGRPDNHTPGPEDLEDTLGICTDIGEISRDRNDFVLEGAYNVGRSEWGNDFVFEKHRDREEYQAYVERKETHAMCYAKVYIQCKLPRLVSRGVDRDPSLC